MLPTSPPARSLRNAPVPARVDFARSIAIESGVPWLAEDLSPITKEVDAFYAIPSIIKAVQEVRARSASEGRTLENKEFRSLMFLFNVPFPAIEVMGLGWDEQGLDALIKAASAIHEVSQY
jgi:hypothetical protein